MEVGKIYWNAENANSRINDLPVVVLEFPLIYPHHINWIPENVANILNNKFLCDTSVSSDKRFLYSDKPRDTYFINYTCNVHKTEMSFRDFMTKMRESEALNKVQEFYCLQKKVSVLKWDQKILEQYQKFYSGTAATYKVLGKWQELTRNLLLYGSGG